MSLSHCYEDTFLISSRWLIFCADIRRDWISCLYWLLSCQRYKMIWKEVIALDGDVCFTFIRKCINEMVTVSQAGVGCCALPHFLPRRTKGSVWLARWPLFHYWLGFLLSFRRDIHWICQVIFLQQSRAILLNSAQPQMAFYSWPTLRITWTEAHEVIRNKESWMSKAHLMLVLLICPRHILPESVIYVQPADAHPTRCFF